MEHPWRKVLAILLLVLLVYTCIETAAAAYRGNSQLSVRIGNQPLEVINLNQSQPVSPYLFGVNVFPQAGTDSLDEPASGFMSYGASIISGLQSANIRLLRFPGGEWGEKHTLSFDQLNAFAKLLTQTGANGMMQAQLTDSVATSSLASRASRAGLMVDYMNNPQSVQRTGKSAPFHPIALWTVGNEPDRLINPDTGLVYTVDEYVKAFIQFSTAMHQNDPTIKVFGPEISQYSGVGHGLTDASGQQWMEGFLKGISEYERQHPNPQFHLLDGVSFHRYPLNDARQASAALLKSSIEWDTLLPTLRQLIRQDFGRDLPVAVTEVNTNPNNAVPQPGIAAVWWADTLGRLMSQQVEYTAFFSAEGVDTPYPLFRTQNLQETPMLRVMQVFAHLQHNLIPIVALPGPVSVYATQDDKQQAVSILLINKSGSLQQAHIGPNSGLLPLSLWPGQDITLQGYSIVVVTLHHSGGTTVDSYIASDTQTSTVIHTICGSQTDALPC